MQMTIAENIKSTIPKTDSAKKYMEFVKSICHFGTIDKSVVGTLMGKLTTMKFDGYHTMHEHLPE